MQFGATYCANFQENLLKIFNISERTKRCFRPSIVDGEGSLPQLALMFYQVGFQPLRALILTLIHNLLMNGVCTAVLTF